MNKGISDIVSRLREQRATIDEAIRGLERLDGADAQQVVGVAKKTAGKKAVKGSRKSNMSEEGRKWIAAAQKKRWAAANKAGKNKAQDRRSRAYAPTTANASDG